MTLEDIQSRKAALQSRYNELTEIITTAKNKFDESQTEQRRLEGAYSELENMEKSLQDKLISKKDKQNG